MALTSQVQCCARYLLDEYSTVDLIIISPQHADVPYE